MGGEHPALYELLRACRPAHTCRFASPGGKAAGGPGQLQRAQGAGVWGPVGQREVVYSRPAAHEDVPDVTQDRLDSRSEEGKIVILTEWCSLN